MSRDKRFEEYEIVWSDDDSYKKATDGKVASEIEERDDVT